MKIVETLRQFEEFKQKYDKNNVILYPIFSDDKINPCINEISVIFVRILNGSKEDYILPFDNVDCQNLDEQLLDLLNNDRYKAVLNKKNFIKIKKYKNLIDLNISNYIMHGDILELSSDNQTTAETSIKSRLYKENNSLTYIPILKLYEHYLPVLDDMTKAFLEFLSSIEKDYSFLSLNNLVIENLSKIEENGIFVDKNVLLSFYPEYENHIINNYVYSDYNIFTLTGRPANSYANLNFNSLNKENGVRKFLTSRFGYEGQLLYIDYTSYHLYLIAKIIGYSFPENVSIHDFLGKYYFEKDDLTEEEYEESKKISFQILYGGISDSIATAIPFFNDVAKFIDKLYVDSKNKKYIETAFFKRKIFGTDDMNKNKIFNYYVQSLETEYNMIILNELNQLMGNMKSKIIMYLYDGFLFDFHVDDIKNGNFDKIKQIIQGKDTFFPVKIYYGSNFHDIIKIKN